MAHGDGVIYRVWVVDLKQIDHQIFLHQRWIYLRSLDNGNSGSAIMERQVQVPAEQVKV